MGADQVIAYARQALKDEVADLDLVFDMIGDDTLKRAFATGRWGRIISITEQDRDGLAEQHGVHFEALLMNPDGDMLAESGALIARPVVRPAFGKLPDAGRRRRVCASRSRSCRRKGRHPARRLRRVQPIRELHDARYYHDESRE